MRLAHREEFEVPGTGFVERYAAIVDRVRDELFGPKGATAPAKRYLRLRDDRRKARTEEGRND